MANILKRTLILLIIVCFTSQSAGACTITSATCFKLGTLRPMASRCQHKSLIVTELCAAQVNEFDLYSNTQLTFHSIITDASPSPEYITRLVREVPEGHIPIPYSVSELKGFVKFLPSAFHKICSVIGYDTVTRFIKIPERSDEERILAALLQLQTEISGKIASMDSYIIQGKLQQKEDMENVMISKIYTYNKLTKIMAAMDLIKNPQYMGFDLPSQKEGWDDILIDIKEKLIEYLRKIPNCYRDTEMKKFVGPQTENSGKFGYAKWLENELGENLTAIVVYGSSAREETEYNDYDNWVVVKDLRKAYEILKGVALTYDASNNQVTVRGIAGKDGKPCTFNLVPEDAFPDIYRLNICCDRHIKHCKVIHGEVNLYDFSEEEMMERSLYSAFLRIKALRGAMIALTKTPEYLIGKKELFEYFIKNMTFIINVCMNYENFDAGRPIDVFSKKQLEQRVHEEGMKLYKYRQEAEHLGMAIQVTSYYSSLLLERHLVGRKPTFEFLDIDAIDQKTKDVLLRTFAGRHENLLADHYANIAKTVRPDANIRFSQPTVTHPTREISLSTSAQNIDKNTFLAILSAA